MFVVMVTGVTAFICTAIIFIMLVLLMSDLMDTYLGSETQYSELHDGEANNDQRQP